MKVAIHNGWLVFDNELSDFDREMSAFKQIAGRIRLSGVVEYTRVRARGPDDKHGVLTLVTTKASEGYWTLLGDHQELLDAYFGEAP